MPAFSTLRLFSKIARIAASFHPRDDSTPCPLGPHSDGLMKYSASLRTGESKPGGSEGEQLSLGFGFTENCWEIGQTLDLT